MNEFILTSKIAQTYQFHSYYKTDGAHRFSVSLCRYWLKMRYWDFPSMQSIDYIQVRLVTVKNVNIISTYYVHIVMGSKKQPRL